MEKLSTFGISKQFVSVTGSSLDQIHTQIIQKGLRSIVLDFSPAQQIDGRQNVCLDSIIFQTRKQQMNHVASTCKEQAIKTPVLLIIEKEGHKSFLEVAKSLPIKDLNILNPKEVESFLNSSFLKKVNDSYYICLLNESQGRGLDAPTSFEIEVNGGISTIIAKTPSSQQEFDQFKGRTKRMCNKGQHFLFLWEKGIKESCDNFLDYHFGTIKNTELIRLNNILNQIIQYNETTQFNYNKATLNESSASIDQSSDENNSEESFVVQKSSPNGKISLKKRQRTQNDEVKHKNESKKREQKEQMKRKLVENKVEQQKQDIEECKFCGNECINPLNCQEEKKNREFTQFCMNLDSEELVLDPITFLKCNDDSNLDQISAVKISETAFQHNQILGKGGEAAFKLDKQLQKRNKNTKKTEILEQQVRRSLRNQKQQIEVKKSDHKTQKELIDDAYFMGYSKSDVHKDMISDEIRVEQYQKAINQLCKGKKVLDLGSGTGILSAFAIKSGAKEVICVDNADVEVLMMKKFKEFRINFNEQVRYIRDSIENLAAEQENPRVPQVDVIVSEWMGYFLLFENMIGSYTLAIQKFLKPEGIMIPQQSTMYLNAAAYNLEANKVAKIYLSSERCKLVKIEQCKPEYLVQIESTSIKTLDFTDRTLQNPLDKGFLSKFEIRVAKECSFNAFVGSFEVKLCKDIFLNTLPIGPETHWKQSIFFIDNPIWVSKDDTIEGTIQVAADQENYRNLIVKFTQKVEGKGVSQTEECFAFE